MASGISLRSGLFSPEDICFKMLLLKSSWPAEVSELVSLLLSDIYEIL